MFKFSGKKKLFPLIDVTPDFVRLVEDNLQMPVKE
jgi:hypothetical protein